MLRTAIPRGLRAVALLSLATTAGPACTSAPPAPPSAQAPSNSPTPATIGQAPTAPAPAPSGPTPSLRRPRPSLGWTVTVYYTAVERLHAGATSRVTGCPRLDCTNGNADLGTYPDSFIRAVRDEGTGRTAAGRYLNWSHDIGYWIDDAPRDSGGRPLRAFQSAAADVDVMRAGTRFTIATCGRDDDGEAVAPEVCGRLSAAQWIITDEFTPGLGGVHHVDVYIGEEVGTDFTNSASYATLNGASLILA